MAAFLSGYSAGQLPHVYMEKVATIARTLDFAPLAQISLYWQGSNIVHSRRAK